MVVFSLSPAANGVLALTQAERAQQDILASICAEAEETIYQKEDPDESNGIITIESTHITKLVRDARKGRPECRRRHLC